MNMQTGQSEELNPQGQGQQGTEVEENGANGVDSGANAGNEHEHEGDKGDQGQSKSQNRKQRLRRLNAELESRNAHLEENNRALGEKLTSLEHKVDGVLNPPKPRPDRVNYESEADYEDDLNQWYQQENKVPQQQNKESDPAMQGNPAAQAQPAQNAQPRLSQEGFDKWMDSCDNASDKYEDFDEVLNNKSIPITGIMADTMMETVGGAETAYFLGKNLAEAERISRLSVPQQVNEIQKLTSKFAPSTTNAPDPIDVASGGGDDTTGKDPEKMSTKEYREWRRQNKANK